MLERDKSISGFIGRVMNPCWIYTVVGTINNYLVPYNFFVYSCYWFKAWLAVTNLKQKDFYRICMCYTQSLGSFNFNVTIYIFYQMSFYFFILIILETLLCLTAVVFFFFGKINLCINMVFINACRFIFNYFNSSCFDCYLFFCFVFALRNHAMYLFL